MSRHLAGWVCLSTLAIVATNTWAAFTPGDILISDYNTSLVLQYSANGTFVRQFNTPGITGYRGATVTPNGNLVTTFDRSNAGPEGFNIFSSSGAVQTSYTSGTYLPGDVSVFADGTIAVSGQNAPGVYLYSPNGVLLRTITSPSITQAFGSTVAPDNTLWVANVFGNSIVHLQEDGTILGTTPTSFNPTDLAVDLSGNLWVADYNGFVRKLTPAGTQLTFWATGTGAKTSGIALGLDQSIYITGEGATSLYHYSTTGTLLGSFTLQDSSHVFVNVVPVPEPACISVFFMVVAGLRFQRPKKARACISSNAHSGLGITT